MKTPIEKISDLLHAYAAYAKEYMLPNTEKVIMANGDPLFGSKLYYRENGIIRVRIRQFSFNLFPGGKTALDIEDHKSSLSDQNVNSICKEFGERLNELIYNSKRISPECKFLSEQIGIIKDRIQVLVA